MMGHQSKFQLNILDVREVPGKNNCNLWIVKPCIKSGNLFDTYKYFSFAFKTARNELLSK